MQDQVALLTGPLTPQLDRLELERQVVAERAVQPQVRVVARHGGDHLPHGGEDGGPAAPVLLGLHAGRLGYHHLDLSPGPAVPAARAGHGLAHPQQGGAKHREQHLAPGVERPDADPAAAGDELGAGIHVGQMPAAVAARVLHARAEHPAAPPFHLRADGVQDLLIERLGGPGDDHPAGGHGACLGGACRLVCLCCRIHLCSLG